MLSYETIVRLNLPRPGEGGVRQIRQNMSEWESATLEETIRDHVAVGDKFLPPKNGYHVTVIAVDGDIVTWQYRSGIGRDSRAEFARRVVVGY